jgi:tRNA pseudouridine38-40 synthase
LSSSSNDDVTDPGKPASLKLIVSYDGSGFAGSQIQPGQRTVQEELERALSRLFNQKTRITLAGRTDQGVHAAAQVASLPHCRPDLDAETIVRALNAQLAKDVAVVSVERIEAGFHARFDAKWREYRYRLWVGQREPLARQHVWMASGRLDAGLMNEAARALVGEHDFGAFAGSGQGVPWSERQEAPRGTIRRVYSSELFTIDPWWRVTAGQGQLLEYRIVADGYLPRMVRTIVGALAEVGRGTQPPAWIDELLAVRDRRCAAGTAPPQGLTLWRIGYGTERPPERADLKERGRRPGTEEQG